MPRIALAILVLMIASAAVGQETGRVEIDFVTQSGRPWVVTGTVHISGRDVQVTRGRAVLDGVPVGESVAALATGPLWVCATGIEGPDRAGATVRRRVVKYLQRPFLDVRLLDTNGTPLVDGDTVVVQRIVREDGRRARGARDRLPVAGGGRVAFAIAPHWRLLALRFVAMRNGRAIGAAEVAIDRPLTNEVHALDDVRLGAATCLARGRLTGGVLPLRHPAWVELHPTGTDEVELRKRQDEAIPPFVCVSWNPHLVRRGAYGAPVDREGRFAIWGIPTDAPFELRACSRGFPPVARRAKAGAVVDLPVECHAVVRGTITPPKGIPAERFIVLAFFQGVRVDVGHVRADGRYVCDRLPVGAPVLLRVELQTGPGQDAFVAEWPVTPASRPTVGIDFDLRGRVPTREVRVIDEAGAPIAGALVSGVGWMTETDDRGVAVIPVVAAGDVSVSHDGFVGARFPKGLPIDVEVRLEHTPRR